MSNQLARRQCMVADLSRRVSDTDYHSCGSSRQCLVVALLLRVRDAELPAIISTRRRDERAKPLNHNFGVIIERAKLTKLWKDLSTPVVLVRPSPLRY